MFIHLLPGCFEGSRNYFVLLQGQF